MKEVDQQELERELIKFSLLIEECYSSTTFANDRALYAKDLVTVIGWLRKLRNGIGAQDLISEISDPKTDKFFGDFWKNGEWADKELAGLAELRLNIKSVQIN